MIVVHRARPRLRRVHMQFNPASVQFVANPMVPGRAPATMVSFQQINKEPTMSLRQITRPNLRTLLLSAAIACAALPLAAGAWPFGGDRVEGNGKIVRQARQAAGFTGVSMGVPGELQLRIGASDSITIETDDNLQPLIETVVEDGVLRIRTTSNNRDLRTEHLKITVQARSIERLSVGGSGTISAAALRGARLNLDVGGSGTIAVASVDSDEVAAKVAGSGDIVVKGGSVRNLTVSVAGSGDVDLGQVAVSDAKVKVAGSGDVTVWAKDTLAMSIAGSGDVRYYGDPRVDRKVAGSGEARRLGGAPR